jgi:4a-hydroxytetrahydrobiopterin dehydratase
MGVCVDRQLPCPGVPATRYSSRVMRPKKLESEDVDRWLAEHAGWELQGDSLQKEFHTRDYPEALAFAVQIGFAAERKDHHPDLFITYKRVRVSWTTHDAGGLTSWDLEMAERCDQMAGRG